MRKACLLAIAVLALVLISCEKKQSETVYEDFQSSTLLRQVGETEEDMQILTYYNTGKIFEHLGRFSYRKFIYNSNQKLEKIEIALSNNPLSCAIIPGATFEDGGDPRKAEVGQFIELSYTSDGKIARKDHYYYHEDIPILMVYEIPEYDGNNIVASRIYNPQDQLTQYRTFQYDAKGNVSIEEYYYVAGQNEIIPQNRIEYEYDNKKNPFSVFAVEGSPGQSSNPNNIKKETITNFYEDVDEEYVYTVVNTYEYNDKNYPIKVNDITYTYGVDQ